MIRLLYLFLRGWSWRWSHRQAWKAPLQGIHAYAVWQAIPVHRRHRKCSASAVSMMSALSVWQESWLIIMIRGQKCCVFQTAPMAPIPLRQYVWQHMSVVMQSSIRKDMDLWYFEAHWFRQPTSVPVFPGRFLLQGWSSACVRFWCSVFFCLDWLWSFSLWHCRLSSTHPAVRSGSLRETECLEKVRSQEQKKCSERQLWLM